MNDWKEDLLAAILDCGYADLYLLEDCRYDLCEIVEECRMNFGKLDINLLVRIMFEYGLRDIETAINDRICELESVENERNLDEDERVELESLRVLDPFENIESFHNYIDTSIWVSREGNKREIYKRYLQDSLDRFEEMTGFQIGTD